MDAILLSLTYTIASLLELILAFYMLIADRRSPGNRALALFFFLLAMNSLSYGSLIGVYSLTEALPWIAVFVISTYMIGPATYLASVAVLRPRWLRHRWLFWPIYILLTLPAILVLSDVTGLTARFSAQPLIFQPPDTATYVGGEITLGATAVGLLSQALLLVQVGFPALALICPMVVVGVRDWKRAPANSAIAWGFFAATLLATASQTVISAQITPRYASLIANFAFIAAFGLAALAPSGVPWNAAALRRSLGSWPVFAKLVLVVVTVFVPSVVIITLVSSSIVRTNITGQIGSSYRSLARLQARSIAETLNTHIANLDRLSQSGVILSTLNLRLQAYRDLDAVNVRSWINQEEVSWVLSDITMVESMPQSFLSSVSVLNEFRANFPEFTYLQLTDPFGALVSATDTPSHFDYSNAGWWRDAYAGGAGAPHISVPLLDQETGARFLQIALPIYAEDGTTVAGVLLGRLMLSDLLTNLATTTIGEGGKSDLFSPGGILIPLAASVNEVPERNIALDWADLLASPTPWRILPYESVSSIVSWATVGDEAGADAPTAGLEWRVTVHQPVNEALQAVSTAQRATVLTTVLTTLAGFGFAWLLAGFITQPISALTGVAQRVLEGDFNVQAEVPGSDEIGVLASTFNTMTAQVRGLVANLENQVASRTADLARQTEKLQAAAQVGQGVISILNVDELMQTTVEVIQERFDLYYVGLFLADERREWAVLQFGTGEAGQRMRERGHRIRIGEGMIGWAVQNAQARVAGDVGSDSIRLATAELPETRSEAAIPMRARGQTVGALTVQSARADEFDPATVNILQTLADQVGIAIDNANLLEQNRAALNESRSALETVRRTYQQVTREAWTESAQRRQWGVLATPRGISWEPPADGKNGRKKKEPLTAGPELSVPIQVREHTIGTIRLRKPGATGPWTPAERQYIENYVSQLGQALDSARLFRDIQSRSVQLQASAEIGRAATSILKLDELLPSAVNLIGERFNLYYAGVFLLDENREWAVLQAGTGEAGRQQVEAGHRLEVGGQSMIGQCVALGQARIAQDVGEEAVRFENPLLPDTRTEMALPLQAGGETIGALTIQSTLPAAFSPDDITVFQTMANQLATAIQNARLYEQSQQATMTAQEQRRIADSLLHSSARFAETQDRDQIIKIIVDEIDQQIRPDQVNVWLMTEETGAPVLAQRFAPGDAEDEYEPGQQIGLGTRPDLANILRTGEHIYLPEVRADGLTHEQYRLPLRQAGRVIGAVEVFHTAHDAHIRDEDRAVIDGIVQQADVALQSATAFRQTQDALGRTNALLEVSRAAMSAESPTQLFQLTANVISRTLGTDRTVIRRIDVANRQILEAIGAGSGVHHSPLHLPFADLMDGLHGWVLAEQKPARSSKDRPDPRDSEATRQLRLLSNCGAILVVPLLARGTVIGMITAINTPDQPDFSVQDEELLVAMANQIGVALQNNELFAETQQTAQNERLLNQIGAQLIQSLDFETILRTAVAEIGQLPNITNVTLTMGDAQPANGDKAG